MALAEIVVVALVEAVVVVFAGVAGALVEIAVAAGFAVAPVEIAVAAGFAVAPVETAVVTSVWTVVSVVLAVGYIAAGKLVEIAAVAGVVDCYNKLPGCWLELYQVDGCRQVFWQQQGAVQVSFASQDAALSRDPFYFCNTDYWP